MNIFNVVRPSETRPLPQWSAWVFLVGWMGLIFLFSNQPSLPQAPDILTDTLLKKLAHATAYAILFLLWARALSGAKSISLNRTLLLALGLTICYAISDEWHQTFVLGRHGQLADVLVDTAGAQLAFILARRSSVLKPYR